MRKKLPALIGLAILAVLPQVLGDEWNWLIFLTNRALVFAIMAVGLNLLTGFAGQISIGHAAFMAVGAFASYGLTHFYGIPFWGAMPVAGLVAGLVGYGLGFPALRLSGHYLAIATLGFGVAVPQLLNIWESLTGGWTGVKPSAPYLFGLSFREDRPYFYLLLVVLWLLAGMAFNIVKTRTGRSFIALRDSEVAAQAMGISLTKYKTMAFAVSAFYAGIGGSLYAHMINYVSPHDFGLGISMELFTIICLGGLASVNGAIIGAVFMSLLPKLVEKVSVALQRSGAFDNSPFLSNMFKNLNQVLTGVILILVVLYLPRGLVDLWRHAREWYGRRAEAAKEVR
ncbi:MAG TPA: branched-chain amino acid ABC transporter permease [Symbiobacteriaceae bacterium]|nr:branched-chain amino acid ABC transporter permease [Symbiobacteriaceae bacterium]